MTSPTTRPVIEPALLNGAGSLTRWANLGFWRDAPAYPEAAAELARRVGRAIGLAPGDVVLDVACGYADSCAMWVREFGVAKVVGVEPDPAVVVDATARIQGWHLADRVAMRRTSAEWVVMRETCPGVTAVVCVDAAYHFDTRRTWLKALAQDLPKGTRLGLADLLFTTAGERSHRVRAFARRAGIPRENLWTAHDVEPTLGDTGFRVLRMVRCGPEVLGGFARFGMRSAARWLRRPADGGWRALATAAALAYGGRRGWLDYAIISAVRV